MSDNSTNIDASLDKTTDNYAVYEGDGLTGTYVALDEFDGEPPEEVTFTFSEDGDITVSKDKDTKNYGAYESDSIVAMYVSHDVLGSAEAEDEDGNRDAPDAIAFSLSTDEADEADDSDEVEVSDEELALPSDD